MNRRRFIIGAAAIAAARPKNQTPFIDGQSVAIGGAEFMLSDVIVPSSTPLSGNAEAGAEFALALFDAIAQQGTLIGAGDKTDRWARIVGPVRWRMKDGSETTMQELLLEQGAARVAPESDDDDFIDRCYAAEDAARAAKRGTWRDAAWRIRDAARAEWSSGFQVYAGLVTGAQERRGRVYVNFGDDYRTDFTATVPAARFRRWKNTFDPAALVNRLVEARGFVERINGPSIELRHEKQIRLR